MIDKKVLDDKVSYKQIFHSINKTLVYICLCLFLIFMQLFIMTLRINEYLKKDENQKSIDSSSAYSRDEVTSYDTISDLTGTEWIINSTSCTAGYGSFDDLEYRYTHDDDYSDCYWLLIGYGFSFNNGLFEAADTVKYLPINNFATIGDVISITGGTDATNTDLISWLQLNATQIQTGYSSTINLTNCTSNKSSESGLSGSYTATITANTGYVLTSVNSSLGSVTYSSDNKVATITISDVYEDFTISASASLIYHNIYYNLGNVVVTSSKPMQIDEISTISITFQPYTNYILPRYINVEGVTSYQWNHESGVLSLTNAFDDVYISINAEYKSGDYTFVDLIDSVTLVPVNTFFNLFDFELFGVNLYHLLLSVLILFIIIKILLKIFR